mmetsp:Transcript_28383/g.60115  ORF Transcript_28383/g.60115 Transcript_28383/m.60115 type:complete len:478 (-) Transcript_28383:141-1574(-)
MMENDEAEYDKSPPTMTARCRVAIIGGQRQRVANVVALLHSDDSLGCVEMTSLSSSHSTASGTAQLGKLPEGVPFLVEIEYLPCVATFDSYEDEHGSLVRYLAKLEYHGPNGTLVKGKSLAPFFDDICDSGGSGGEDNRSPFPGIVAAAIGCGIETEEDVDKVQSSVEALSFSCAAQLLPKRTDSSGRRGLLVECIRPNQEYSSMKEENEAYRELSHEKKKEAVSKGIIGPGKMANFVYDVAKCAIRQNLGEKLSEHEKSLSVEDQQMPLVNDETTPMQAEPQAPELESKRAPIEIQFIATHAPNSNKNRYACKRCRSILFGEEDLEDPPHAQSLHNFRKRGAKAGCVNIASSSCQNHCIAQPLKWMNGCSEMEGKLHCPKCNTKVGHYSWTGAQCSCGTWVTPAIMVPLSKVDEMKPMSRNVFAATGALLVDHRELIRSSSTRPSTANNILGMNHLIGSMSIVGEGVSSLKNGSSA